MLILFATVVDWNLASNLHYLVINYVPTLLAMKLYSTLTLGTTYLSALLILALAI